MGLLSGLNPKYDFKNAIINSIAEVTDNKDSIYTDEDKQKLRKAALDIKNKGFKVGLSSVGSFTPETEVFMYHPLSFIPNKAGTHEAQHFIDHILNDKAYPYFKRLFSHTFSKDGESPTISERLMGMHYNEDDINEMKYLKYLESMATLREFKHSLLNDGFTNEDIGKLDNEALYRKFIKYDYKPGGYRIPTLFELRGPEDMDKIKEALQLLVQQDNKDAVNNMWS